MTTWLCTVLRDPTSNGDSGGAWRLIVSRSRDARWWTLIDDSLDGPEVYRDEEGLIALVHLASSQPFEEAAREYGLDVEAFGSPTLWIPAHVEHLAEADGPGRPHGNSRHVGWTWVVSSENPAFPFMIA